MKIKNAKAAAKRVTRVPAAITPTALPKGFKAVSSGIAPSWHYSEQPLLVGKIISFGEVESRYKDKETKKFIMQKTCVVEQDNGTTVTVWESAGTRALFDLKKGAQVAIAFNGLRKIKGRKEPMKDFTVATK